MPTKYPKHVENNYGIFRGVTVIPTEIGLPTIRTATPELENEGSVIRELDTSDELREAATIRVTSYQRHLAYFYNKRVRP